MPSTARARRTPSSRTTLHYTALMSLVAACSEPTARPERPPISGVLNQSMARSERPFTFAVIEVPGALNSAASGIGPSGDIVGSYADATGATHGFLLSNGEFTTIDYPGAMVTEARGIGPNGEIIGTYRMPGEPAVNFHGFLRTRQGEFVRVDYPGHTSIIAQRLLPDGTVLGCRHDNDLMVTMRGISMGRDGTRETDAFASMHNGATPDGRLIVGLYTDMMTNRTEGYVIEDGVFTPLVVPGSNLTQAWDVSPAGEIVGIYRTGAVVHGFLLTEDGYLTLDMPGATATRAFGINAAGDVVGSFVAGGRTHGFLASRRGR